jgi:hypothetical protein
LRALARRVLARLHAIELFGVETEHAKGGEEISLIFATHFVFFRKDAARLNLLINVKERAKPCDSNENDCTDQAPEHLINPS